MGYGAATLGMGGGDKVALRLAARTLHRPMIFDVGANVGDFAQQALAMFREARVWCFEPSPDTFTRLERHLAHEPRATLVEAAVGEHPGSAVLYGEDVLASLVSREGTGIPVNVVRLDDYVREHTITQVDYLKLDVEGAELSALRGASNLIASSRVRFVQFEFGALSALSRTFLRDFYDLLDGYEFFRLTTNGAVPLGPYRPELEVFASETNYLARACS